MQEADKDAVLGKDHLPRTLILDIDGTILDHYGEISQIVNPGSRPDALPGVVKKINEAMRNGHHILLVTARPEIYRGITMAQLANAGIAYHQLVMGVAHGARILINDLAPGDDGQTAVGISVKRNAGIGNLNIKTGRLD